MAPSDLIDPPHAAEITAPAKPVSKIAPTPSPGIEAALPGQDEDEIGPTPAPALKAEPGTLASGPKNPDPTGGPTSNRPGLHTSGTQSTAPVPAANPGGGGGDAAVRALFTAELTAALAEIDRFRLQNGTGDANLLTGELTAYQEHGKAELEALKAQIDAAGTPLPDALVRDLLRQVWRIVGRHRELVARMDLRPFAVSFINERGEIKRHLEKDDVIVDIVLNTRDCAIPEQAGKLKVDLDLTTNVIRTVLDERLRSSPGLLRSRAVWEKKVTQTKSDYLAQAMGIASVGLETSEPTRMAFARTDLARLTTLFTLREAGVVKNGYVNRLAGWSLVAVGLFMTVYAVARSQILGGDLGQLLYNFRNFTLLASGTAIGTWLSFSLRRQELTFMDLAVLEPDRLNPAERIAFMIGLSCLVGLLFYSGALIAGVGNVNGPDALHTNGSSAMLLGLLAGVAERALGTAVTRRSLDFATLVGGGAPGTPPITAVKT